MLHADGQTSHGHDFFGKTTFLDTEIEHALFAEDIAQIDYRGNNLRNGRGDRRTSYSEVKHIDEDGV